MTGGVAGLAGAIVLGPRIGKFNKDGSANAIPGHNIAMVVLGTLILAFGWFGFNAGSDPGRHRPPDRHVRGCTMLATAAAGASSLLYMWAVFGKPDPTMAATACSPAPWRSPPRARSSPDRRRHHRRIAGVLVIWSVLFVEKVLKVDDPSARSASTASAAPSAASASASSPTASTARAGTAPRGPAPHVVWSGSSTTAAAGPVPEPGHRSRRDLDGHLRHRPRVLKIQNTVMKGGIRPTAEVELMGMDMPEMGALAYPEFVPPRARHRCRRPRSRKRRHPSAPRRHRLSRRSCGLGPGRGVAGPDRARHRP